MLPLLQCPWFCWYCVRREVCTLWLSTFIRFELREDVSLLEITCVYKYTQRDIDHCPLLCFWDGIDLHFRWTSFKKWKMRTKHAFLPEGFSPGQEIKSRALLCTPSGKSVRGREFPGGFLTLLHSIVFGGTIKKKCLCKMTRRALRLCLATFINMLLDAQREKQELMSWLSRKACGHQEAHTVC